MKSLVSLLSLCKLSTPLDITLTDITLDSRAVKPGTLFCAVKGHHLDGHDFISDALRRGARAIFCESAPLNPDARIFVIPDLYQRLGELADFFYDHPSHHLKVIGVTGTSGKTSTTHYLAELLDSLEQRAAVIGSVGNGLWGHLSEAELTTPDVLSLHKLLREYANQGAKWVAMEVSSHALDQNRVDHLRFYGAIFTNLTQDHLDYHHTMAAYGAAKARLFERPELKIAVLNAEDPFSHTLVKKLPLTTQCFFYDSNIQVETQLLGVFNNSNVNAALTFLCAAKLPKQKLATAAALLHSVKGRMEILRYPNTPLIIIDHAHKPDALEKVLIALKIYQKKVWVVFGCGGDRDALKRPLMAKAAETHADAVIVTEDNSRTETIEAIFADIRSGFQDPDRVHFMPDRTDAIAFALHHAKPADIVVLAGKGHETYRDKNGLKSPYDEREVVKKIILQ